MNPRVSCSIVLFAATAAVLAPRFDLLADRSFAWHMLQHLVLLYATSLAILLLEPLRWMQAALGYSSAARLLRVSRGLRRASYAPYALVAFVALLWAIHFSALFEMALDTLPVHIAEHGLFVLAGVLFWLPVLSPPPLWPLSFPARLLYLIVMLPQGALLAAALGDARRALYPHYAHLAPLGSVLADQQAGAALMWIGSGIAVFTAFVATLGVWALRERRAPMRIEGEST